MIPTLALALSLFAAFRFGVWWGRGRDQPHADRLSDARLKKLYRGGGQP